MKPVHELLESAWKRKSRMRGRYSLSALAKDAKVSRGFLRQVMQGERPPSPKLLPKLFEILNLEEYQRKQIYTSLAYGRLPTAEARKLFRAQKREAIVPLESLSHFNAASPSELSAAVMNWYSMAILDMVCCKNFRPEAQWIADQLNISLPAASNAIDRLFHHGVLVVENGKWKKVAGRMEFVSKKIPLPIMRQFHQQMSAKAIEVMQKGVTPEEFQRRYMGGLTVATNRKSMEKARTYIHEVLAQFFEILQEGEPEEVYHLNLQLFPLMKNPNFSKAGE